jgi:hypothetical protein
MFRSPCHHSMARPQATDVGYGLQIWRVSADVADIREGVVLHLEGLEWG